MSCSISLSLLFFSHCPSVYLSQFVSLSLLSLYLVMAHPLSLSVSLCRNFILFQGESERSQTCLEPDGEGPGLGWSHLQEAAGQGMSVRNREHFDRRKLSPYFGGTFYQDYGSCPLILFPPFFSPLTPFFSPFPKSIKVFS